MCRNNHVNIRKNITILFQKHLKIKQYLIKKNITRFFIIYIFQAISIKIKYPQGSASNIYICDKFIYINLKSNERVKKFLNLKKLKTSVLANAQ